MKPNTKTLIILVTVFLVWAVVTEVVMRNLIDKDNKVALFRTNVQLLEKR